MQILYPGTAGSIKDGKEAAVWQGAVNSQDY
jgi:hypothetical protein